MKKIGLFVCALVLSVGALVAQSEDELKAQALVDAQASGDAALQWNPEQIFKYTHPKVATVMGGKDKMLATLDQMKSQLDASGVSIDGYKAVAVKEFLKEEGEYRCLVETMVQMSMPGQKMDNKSHLFGFYIADTKHWTFVEASQMKGPLKTQIFLCKLIF